MRVAFILGQITHRTILTHKVAQGVGEETERGGLFFGEAHAVERTA